MGQSNNATQDRRSTFKVVHTREDEKFASLVNHMLKSGEPVSEQEIENVGPWQEELDALIEDLRENGPEGFLNGYKSLLKANPSMNKLMATYAEPEQEELHPDFKIGSNGKKVYQTLTEEDIDAFPDATYLVSGMLQTATVSMLFGESNTGKTFIALHTAQCVARGLNWLGRPVEQGPVLYIYAEGKLGLKPRLQAWRKHYNLPPTPNVRYIAHPVQLLSERETLIDTIEDQEVKPVLVIIDTFSNCAIGTNQNDQMEVAKILATAHEIARDYGSHVMVAHHTNRQGTMNGSAAFRNHVDTMIELSRDGKDGPLTLKCEKQRDAGLFSDIALNLSIVDLGINEKTFEPVTSCVVVASSSPAAEKTPPQAEQKMLEILSMLGRASYGTWQRECEKAQVVKATSFFNRSKKLVDQGLVKKMPEGEGKHSWYEVIQPLQPLQTTSHELVEVVTN